MPQVHQIWKFSPSQFTSANLLGNRAISAPVHTNIESFLRKQDTEGRGINKDGIREVKIGMKPYWKPLDCDARIAPQVHRESPAERRESVLLPAFHHGSSWADLRTGGPVSWEGRVTNTSPIMCPSQESSQSELLRSQEPEIKGPKS